MFCYLQSTVEAFVQQVDSKYKQTFPHYDEKYKFTLLHHVRVSMNILSQTDCAYHDIHHTILTIQVAQEILFAKNQSPSTLSEYDYVHILIAALYHDIGYRRGVLQGDRLGKYIINNKKECISIPEGSTDASMAPYHIDRGVLFVLETFHNHSIIDGNYLANAIRMTKFPIPQEEPYLNTTSLTALLRCADLIGQMGDPFYIQKMSKLFTEFNETGEAVRLNLKNPTELRQHYPIFFKENVFPYIQEGIALLSQTNEGRTWLSFLFSHLKESSEASGLISGPEMQIPRS